MPYIKTKLATPASIAGWSLLIGVVVGEKLELEAVEDFLGLVVLVVFLAAATLAVADLDDVALAGGAVITLTAAGVATVVHCHSPSADTQA